MMKDRKFIIYKIINKINNKEYIGKHETYNVYDTYFGSGMLLKLAIKKYNKENFEKVIIEYCDNAEHLSEREIYWISEINTFPPNGYNINPGGRGGDNFTNNPNKKAIKRRMIKNVKIRIYTDEEKEACRQRVIGTKLKPHKKINCGYCDKNISQANYNRWHGKFCKSNPNAIEVKLKTINCEHCKKICTPSIYSQHHGKFCKKNVDRVNKKKVLCKHCNKKLSEVNYKIYHGDNCKKNPLFIENPELLKKTKGYIISSKSTKTKTENGKLKHSKKSNKKRSETLKNRVITDEVKKKMSVSNKKRWLNLKKDIKYYTCEVCKKKIMLKINLDRWHNDNCTQ